MGISLHQLPLTESVFCPILLFNTNPLNLIKRCLSSYFFLFSSSWSILILTSGTLLASISILFGCRTEYGSDKWKRAFVISFCISLTQMVTAIFVLGWVWSIMWGINFIKREFLIFLTRNISNIPLSISLLLTLLYPKYLCTSITLSLFLHSLFV